MQSPSVIPTLLRISGAVAARTWTFDSTSGAVLTSSTQLRISWTCISRCSSSGLCSSSSTVAPSLLIDALCPCGVAGTWNRALIGVNKLRNMMRRDPEGSVQIARDLRCG